MVDSAINDNLEEMSSDIVNIDSNKQESERPKLIVNEKKTKIEIIGSDFEIRISKFSGNITSIMYNSKEYLIEPIRVYFDSNEVNEDIVDENVNRILLRLIKDFYKRGDKQTIESIHLVSNDSEAIVEINKKIRSLKNCLVTKYIVGLDGSVIIKNSLTPKKDIYGFGTSMAVPKGIDVISWIIDDNADSMENVEQVKLLNGLINSEGSKNSEIKYKIKAKKSNVKAFLLTNDRAEGLRIEADEQEKLSVRANYNQQNDIESHSLKSSRIKDSVMINIEYRKNITSSHVYGVNYEEEYKLKKNTEYSYSYKITNANNPLIHKL